MGLRRSSGGGCRENAALSSAMGLTRSGSLAGMPYPGVAKVSDPKGTKKCSDPAGIKLVLILTVFPALEYHIEYSKYSRPTINHRHRLSETANGL